MNKKLVAVAFIVVIVVAGGAAAYWFYFIMPGLRPENPYDFAIVFATGGLGDRSFNDGCYAGAEDVAAAHNLNWTYLLPTTQSDFFPMLQFFASHMLYRNPFKIIIAVGFDQADAVTQVAGMYPMQKFAIIDMFVDNTTRPNVASMLFDEEEGCTLTGVLAGLYTTQDKIGFVGGMNIDLIRKFAAGYFFGANLTNPAIALNATSGSPNIQFSYVGAWNNPTTGQAHAATQYAAGADIIFAAAGGSGLGVFSEAKTRNATSPHPLWVIGVDFPQMYLGTANPDTGADPPTLCLTTALKRVDLAVFNIVKDACVDDDFVSGIHLGNLANGMLGWEQNATLLTHPPTYIAIVEDYRQAIINGTIDPPSDYAWLNI